METADWQKNADLCLRGENPHLSVNPRFLDDITMPFFGTYCLRQLRAALEAPD
jgi:hypothetical protein